MKQSIFSLLAALILAFPSYAQQNESILKGKVFDKASNEGAGWTTVSLMASDSTIVSATACNENGEYSLSASRGEYFLTASLMGYKDFSQTVTLKPGVNEISPIYLDTDTEMLATLPSQGLSTSSR